MFCNFKNLISRYSSKTAYLWDFLSTIVMKFVEHPKNPRFIDLTWNKYSRLEVLWYAGNIYRKYYWYCKCDCWKFKKIPSSYFKSWNTKSCWCLHKEKVKEKTTHWMWYSTEYTAYYSARQRCNNINNPAYNNYGWRGVRFSFESFEEFYEHIWPKPTKKHTLDRIDNNQNYEIWNVRWATMKVQVNNRRNTIWISDNNKMYNLYYRTKNKVLRILTKGVIINWNWYKNRSDCAKKMWLLDETLRLRIVSWKYTEKRLI